MSKGPELALIDNATNERLLSDASPVALAVSDEIWKPRDEHEELRTLLALKLDEDQVKVRLITDLYSDVTTVTVQPTPYSAFSVSNRLGIIELRKRGSSQPLLQPANIGLRNSKLPKLARSRCSNHIGVSVIGIGNDGLILTRQTHHNSQNPGLWVPTGSGSADFADLGGVSTLNQFLKRAMARELSEEIGLTRSKQIAVDDVRVLGYARFVHLLGKPEFFGVARLGDHAASVSNREQRYILDHTSLDFDPSAGVNDLARTIRNFEREEESDISFQLHVNLLLLIRWLERDASALHWLERNQPVD